MKKKIGFLVLSFIIIVALALNNQHLAADGGHIRDRDSGEVYLNFTEALAATAQQDKLVFELSGDLLLNSVLYIEKDITLVPVSSSVNLDMTTASITVRNGGNLTLGESTNNSLTIKSSGNCVVVTNGKVTVNPDVKLLSSSGKGTTYALRLDGANAQGTINGGYFEASLALYMDKGAYIDVIKNGDFLGKESAASINGENTRIDKIQGGRFIKTDDSNARGTFYVQAKAVIGEISGGYFEGGIYSVLMIMRGGWVEKISGGEFRSTTISANNSGINVFNDSSGLLTGIGEISGGTASGGQLGIWLYGPKSRIDVISGGTFTGNRGLQVDVSATIGVVKNATFNGAVYGIFNFGVIDEIGPKVSAQSETYIALFNYDGTKDGAYHKGQVTKLTNVTLYGADFGIVNQGIISEIADNSRITGKNEAGIYNKIGASIDIISDSQVVSDKNAVVNYGNIAVIADSGFEGGVHALKNVGSEDNQRGVINKIDSSTFYAHNDVAIVLASELVLEASISGNRGSGNYWGKDAVIFNNEDLVSYPPGYWLSEETRLANNFGDNSFRYLTNGQTEVVVDEGKEAEEKDELVSVVILNSFANEDKSGVYHEFEEIVIDAGDHPNPSMEFSGWVCPEGVLIEESKQITVLKVPHDDVVVTATWKKAANINQGGVNTGDSLKTTFILAGGAGLALIVFIIAIKAKRK